MEYSSGIIIHKKIDGEVRFFVCTPKGPYWKNRVLYNFPKGHIDDGESAFDAAIREFYEETSVMLDSNEHNYLYHGIVQQNKSKKVHVFSKEYDGEDLSHCSSNKTTTIINGKKIIHEEVGGYTWLTSSELQSLGIPCYINILKKIENECYNN